MTTPQAIVIGSGFGGLAAAIRLQCRGYSTQIFEKLPEAGGRARVFRRGGYTFDAGPTVITAPFLLEELFTLCGESLADHVTMLPVDPFYRIYFADGTHFNYNGDALHMQNEVAKFSPQDVVGYERFIEKSAEIFRIGFEKLAHVPFTHWTDMARILPSMIHLRSFRSVYQMACHYLKDPKLRQVFSFHPLLVGGNPFNTSSIYTLILYLERRYGVYFPRGGTTQLVNSLLQLFLRKGGVFHANSPVKHIVVREKMARGIRLENGQEYVADIVVANSDVAWTYKHLIAPEYRRHWTNRRLARQRYSMGLFVWYFGTNKQYTDVAHHTILLGARYKELLLDIFQRKILAEDFSLYVHRPTATDPTLAPPGGDTFYVLSPVPNLQGKINWAEVAPRYQKKLAKFLEQTILPELEAHLVESFWVTPEYFANTLWSEAGAAFSMEPTLTQSAYFRPHNQSEDIQNLFFVGAGTHPGAGLPGVLSSAKVLEHILPAAAACVA